ncbi:alpha/beta hydrolase family protein [Bacteroidota bacterium]
MIFDPVIDDPVKSDKEYPASLRSIILESKGSKLLSTLLLAEGAGPHPTILLLHGFPGNENNFDIAHAARRLGWNVFTFHYRGMWGSEGEFSWNNCIEDVTVAVDFLKSNKAANEYRIDNDKIVLMGYSMGGFMAMMHTAKDRDIKSAASLAGFNFGLAGEMIEKLPNGREIAKENMALGVSFAKGTDTEILLEELLKYASEFNLLNYIKEYSSKNILMVGAANDATAPLDLHYYPIVNALKSPTKGNLTSKIIEAGHGFSTKRIELTRTVVDWLKEIKF